MKGITTTVWVAVAVAGLLLGSVTAWFVNRGATAQTVLLMPQARPLPDDLRLIGPEGGVAGSAIFQGSLSLVFFGFTNCPDICPLTLQVMSQTRQLMDAEQERPQMVFVSVDPQRDDPRTIAEYLGFFDPEIAGFTGSADNLERLYRTLGVAVHIPDHEPGADYEVGHSSGLYVVDAAGRYRGLYRPPFDAPTLAAELPGLIRQLRP